VKETIELGADGGNNAIGAMTDVRTANATREIDESIAVHVFDRRALGSRGEHRRCMIDAAGHRLRAAAH
jgi:hypothetical protein